MRANRPSILRFFGQTSGPPRQRLVVVPTRVADFHRVAAFCGQRPYGERPLFGQAVERVVDLNRIGTGRRSTQTSGWPGGTDTRGKSLTQRHLQSPCGRVICHYISAVPPVEIPQTIFGDRPARAGTYASVVLYAVCAFRRTSPRSKGSVSCLLASGPGPASHGCRPSFCCSSP
jgi:hypothetical protein